MMGKLEGKKVLMFVEDYFEDLELFYPKIFLKGEGAEVIVAGKEKDQLYHGKNGLKIKPDKSLDEVDEKDFDGLVIPGGYCPDKLRRIDKVLQLTRDFDKAGKLIAHICHAGWVPVSAGIMKGRKSTSFFAIKDDLINAGADWVDEPIVIEKNLVSSRGPDDLPQFCNGIAEVLTNKN
jgi:protease I